MSGPEPQKPRTHDDRSARNRWCFTCGRHTNHTAEEHPPPSPVVERPAVDGEAREALASALCEVPSEWLEGLARGDTDRHYPLLIAGRLFALLASPVGGGERLREHVIEASRAAMEGRLTGVNMHLMKLRRLLGLPDGSAFDPLPEAGGGEPFGRVEKCDAPCARYPRCGCGSEASAEDSDALRSWALGLACRVDHAAVEDGADPFDVIEDAVGGERCPTCDKFANAACSDAYHLAGGGEQAAREGVREFVEDVRQFALLAENDVVPDFAALRERAERFGAALDGGDQ